MDYLAVKIYVVIEHIDIVRQDLVVDLVALSVKNNHENFGKVLQMEVEVRYEEIHEIVVDNCNLIMKVMFLHEKNLETHLIVIKKLVNNNVLVNSSLVNTKV